MIHPPLAAGSDRLAAPLRILRVISTLRPSAGGPREGLILSTEALARDGHMTEAATCDPPDAPWLKDIALRVHPLGPSIGRSYFFTPRLVPWLKANRDRFDVVIAHGVWNFASVATWRGLKGGRTPYLLFTHGMLDPYFGRAQPWKWRAKQAFWWALEGRALSDAAAVLFTTEEERQLATQAFPGHRYRARVVAYGAAQPGGDPHAQVERFRAALPALGTSPFLLFLSRIHPKKGCDLLLEAFAFLADRRPDLHLVIAGPDETGWRAQLERLAVELGISQRVHWPGLLAGDRKWGAFRACEAFVLPSHQENFGIVVAEAMGCGAPVLITNKVNIWREVEAVGAGLVSSDDRQGVTDLLSRFLELGPAERRLMGERAKAAARERFSIEAAAADLVRAVEEIRV